MFNTYYYLLHSQGFEISPHKMTYLTIEAIISIAVAFIFGEHVESLPVSDEAREDKYFIGDTILKIAETLQRDGAPTSEMLDMSIKIGDLEPDDCSEGHITIRSLSQNGNRDATPLTSISYDLCMRDREDDDNAYPSDFHTEFGRSFDFELCQACPTFMTALHNVHAAGFTPETITERAKAYWLATYGFW